MVGLRLGVATACVAACCASGAQISEDTTLESYFSSNRLHHGLFHYLSWGQTNVRFTNNLKVTVSGLTAGGHNSYDEACISIEEDNRILRLGRIKTAFGFSNWSEVFYNGFNHIPIMRLTPLANGLILTRDDAGAELTFGTPNLQAQAAVIDTSLSPAQFAPKRADHASVRLQTNQGDFIVAADVLKSLLGSTDVYGLDARWSVPRLLVRAEVMAGRGSIQSSWGYYVDAAYRIPKLTRTQAVVRIEGVTYGHNSQTYTETAATQLNTVGVRQIVSPNLAVNLNYGWGSGADNSYVTGNGLKGWTLRMMYQLHF
jgi:hypothetical protein